MRTRPLEVEALATGENGVRIIQDAVTGEHVLEVAEGGGMVRIVGNDITMTEQGYERHTITADGPETASATSHWTVGLSRGAWSTRSETRTQLTLERDSFRIRATMQVWHGDELVAEKDWDERIARTFV